MEEQWKDVVGFEGFYQVSNLGVCKRVDGSLVPIHRGGWKRQYLRVRFCKGSLKDNAASYIHRVVLMAFVGPPPTSSHQANHKDGDKTNNRLDNLEWVTPCENQRHRYDTLGQTQNGEQNGSNKYPEHKIKEILRLYREGGMTQRAIAATVGIDYRYVNAIIKRRAWAHIE